MIDSNNLQNLGFKVADSAKTHIDTSPFASQKAQYDDRKTRIDTSLSPQYDGLIAINDKNTESKLADSIESIKVTSQKAQHNSLLAVNDNANAESNNNSTISQNTESTNQDSKANIESIDDDDAIVFDEINVSATKLSENEKPFNTPGSVSSRGELIESTQDLDKVVRSIPGGYTQIDQSQGTISINIRGLTGFGRVNTQIDGITQTFYGSSSEKGLYHTNYMHGTSAFGAAIDQNLLSGIDMTRGTFSGANGGNALMGSANLRTLSVDDLIIDSKRNYGIIAKAGYGTNKIGPNAMLGAAYKYAIDDSKNLGVLFALSGRYMQQGYRVGGGGNVDDEIKDPTTDFDGDGVPDIPTQPGEERRAIMSENLTQRPINTLFKLEYGDSNNQAILSHRYYNNDIGGRIMHLNALQLNYKFSNLSPFVNINFVTAYNDARQIYNENATILEMKIDDFNLRTANNSFSVNLSNTANLNFNKFGYLKLSAGINYLFNNYENSFNKDDPRYATGTNADGSANYIKMIRYAFPVGNQNILTTYLNAGYSIDIYNIESSINHTYYRNATMKGTCSSYNIWCDKKEAGAFSAQNNDFNASVIFSVGLHSLFTPFVSYARTARAPTIQEQFYSSSVNGSNQDINTNLKSEKAHTWQIGFNSFKQNLIFKDDSFGFKAAYFESYVDDFIVVRAFKVPFNTSNGGRIAIPINWDKLATFKGVEMELNYEMQYFYTRMSFTYQHSNRPYSVGEKLSNNATHAAASTMYSELPQTYGNFDLGVQAFDRKVASGVLIKYTGRGKRINPSDTNTALLNAQNYDDISNVTTQWLPAIPTIFDFYITYKPFKYLHLKFEIQNLMDENYMDTLYTYNSSKNQTGLIGDATFFNNSARGRTYIFNITARW